MTMPNQNSIFLFRNDLRLHDNPAFTLANGVSARLLCVFIVEPNWFRADQYQSAPMGVQRWRFMVESLVALDQALRIRGQKLHVLWGNSVAVLRSLLATGKFQRVIASESAGVYERQTLHQTQLLADELGLDNFQVVTAETNLLYRAEQLPFSLQELPKGFTGFRKKVERLVIDPPQEAPRHFAPRYTEVDEGIQSLYVRCSQIPKRYHLPMLEGYVHGGEMSGARQLQDYLFGSDAVATYKQTRNGMLHWYDSSKLSPWLANGCLSARQVAFSLKHYEQARIVNESTYWLLFELWWREYFHWHLLKYQTDLFRFGGTQNASPNTTFHPARFAKWCAGETPFPIVNACMKQLNKTGYLSNRGRQLVASCLINELQIDWRYGAAYFEQQLVDFDVAANWGNWQYLAGVGVDPRGTRGVGRHFDLAKQAAMYDPKGEFVKHWKGAESVGRLDDVDIVDWPVV